MVDADGGSGIVFDVDFFKVRNEAHVLQRLFVIFYVFVGFGGAFVIVEGDAGRDHVEHDGALMGDGGLEHGAELALVAGEGAADESCAEFDGQAAGIDGRKIVDDSGFQLRTEIGGGGELAFGEAVDAVVFDDVDHGKIAAHEVNELADADGGGVAVAADAEGDQIAVGEHGAGGDGGHASVHGVEAVRTVHEIRGALRGAADAAELDDALGLHAHVIHGFDDALGDGVVAAAGAERGLAAFVLDDGEADAVGFGFWRLVVVAIIFPPWCLVRR